MKDFDCKSCILIQMTVKIQTRTARSMDWLTDSLLSFVRRIGLYISNFKLFDSFFSKAFNLFSFPSCNKITSQVFRKTNLKKHDRSSVACLPYFVPFKSHLSFSQECFKSSFNFYFLTIITYIIFIQLNDFDRLFLCAFIHSGSCIAVERLTNKTRFENKHSDSSVQW